jgi:hypothetical protein
MVSSFILKDKLDGATNHKGMHLYIFPIYIIEQSVRVFVGDVHLEK